MEVTDLTRAFGLAWIAALTALTPLQASSQPTVISPQDVARTAQLTTVTNDFSTSPAYQLDEPAELFISIQNIHLPDKGYAQIVFTIDDLGEGAQDRSLAPDKPYIATLQTTNNVKKLKLKKKDFERGAAAVLLAWPATQWNQTQSDFLVDELILVNNGKRYAFQPTHENMKKHRKAKLEDASYR